MTTLRFGIVGTGMIAEVITQAIKKVDAASVAAVSSRVAGNAESFAQKHNIPYHFATWQEMLHCEEVDAVYIATPTYAKEEIALAAAEAKKHLLVDKPFLSLASVSAMVDASKANGTAFMDGTHFVHHPRTLHIKQKMEKEIGSPQAIHSNFFFPFMDTTNIRFQPNKEPKTAVGDLAWYCMRAVAEYMPQAQEVIQISGFGQRMSGTNSVIRASAHIEFNDGLTKTFHVGYNAGVCLMDLDIFGHTGLYHLDDFVLDWQSGFPFDRPDYKVGYTLRQDMKMPSECEYVHIQNPVPQTERMIQRFTEFASNPTSTDAQTSIQTTLKTQAFLDVVWDAVK